jgi:hypothetical protein
MDEESGERLALKCGTCGGLRALLSTAGSNRSAEPTSPNRALDHHFD